MRVGVRRTPGAATPLLAPVLAAVVLLALPRAAVSAQAPDSATIAGLRDAATTHNRFRIVAGREQFIVSSLRMDANGVIVRFPQAHPALIVTSEPGSAEVERASWAEIERIDGARSHGLRGAMIGAVVGGLVGLGAKATVEGSLHDASGVAILAIPIGAVLGAAVGAIAGGTSRWEPLYGP